MKSRSERGYLAEFFLACLGYFLFTAQDAIVKFMAEDYGVIQIIFVNAWFAFIPIILYTQTLHGWEKLKNASFTVHFFRTLTMCVGLYFVFTVVTDTAIVNGTGGCKNVPANPVLPAKVS